MNPGKQLEMVYKKECYLDDIPDYEKKLKAWQYISRSDNAIAADFENIRSKYHVIGPGVVGACRLINQEVGFPMAIPNDKKDKIHYLNVAQILDYCKDILDDDLPNETLPMRPKPAEFSKAA